MINAGFSVRNRICIYKFPAIANKVIQSFYCAVEIYYPPVIKFDQCWFTKFKFLSIINIAF